MVLILMEKLSEILNQYSSLVQANNSSGRKFHRLSRAIHCLDKTKPDEPILLALSERFERKRDSAKSDQMFVEYSLLCGHLSWLGSLQKVAQLSDGYQEFALRNTNEGLLCRDEDAIAHEGLATFFLPAHERSVSENSKGTNGFRRDLFEDWPKEHFFPRIQNILAKVWPTTETAVSARSLDAKLILRNVFIQFMHKQLLQNALTHAYADATFNPNYNKFYLDYYGDAGADFLFGSLAFLDIQILDPKKISKERFSSELSAIHLSLADEKHEIFDRLAKQKARILSFSYCDTGPGIERHVRHFSPRKGELPKKFDAKFVVDNEVAGRSASGAGKGLSDVRQLAMETNATLVIETPDSTYLYNATEGTESSNNSSRVPRGTSVTLLFEI